MKRKNSNASQNRRIIRDIIARSNREAKRIGSSSYRDSFSTVPPLEIERDIRLHIRHASWECFRNLETDTPLRVEERNSAMERNLETGVVIGNNNGT